MISAKNIATSFGDAGLDRVLDRSVLGGFSRLGFRARGLHRDPVTTRMDGRTVVVTGATSGIGLAASRRLAELGADLVLVGRDRGRLETAIQTIPGGARGEVADLSLMGSVRDLADRLLARETHIDVLVNNVGVLRQERSDTSEGLETTFATNLLSHFVLTNALLPLLSGTAGRPGRIISVSSGGMYTTSLDLDQLVDPDPYRGSVAYARTKRGQVALTETWAERLAGTGIVAHAMHPGWVDTPGVSGSLPRFHRLVGPILRTPEEGADTIVWLAADDEAATATGGFWHDRAIRPTDRLPTTGIDAEDREALWNLLEIIESTIKTETEHIA